MRRTDALSLNRASFAIKLRDFEAYERDLPPKTWQPIRQAFYESVINHVLVPQKYFELAGYMPRVLRLAAVSEDFKHLSQMLKSLRKLITEVHAAEIIKIAGLNVDAEDDERKSYVEKWQEKLLKEVDEQIVAAFPFRLSASSKKAWEEEINVQGFDRYYTYLKSSVSVIQKQTIRLFNYDLAHNPL